jgi:hypothetical protein
VPAEGFQLLAIGGDHFVEAADVGVDGKAVGRGLARIVGEIGLGMLRRFGLAGGERNGSVRGVGEDVGNVALDVAAEAFPSFVGTGESGQVAELRVGGGDAFEVVLVVDLGFVAGSVDQPEIFVFGEERGLVVGEEPLDKAEHGRDAGAGGDEDGVGEGLAEGEESVGAVELDGFADGHVGEEVGEESVFDAIDAEVELVAAGGRGERVGAGLEFAAGIGADEGNKLAGSEIEGGEFRDIEGEVEGLSAFREQVFGDEAGGGGGAIHRANLNLQLLVKELSVLSCQ